MSASAGVQSGSPDTISVWEQLRKAIDIAGYRPRLREAVLWREFTTSRGEPYVIVQSAEAGTYLRLTPEDFFLFQLMDGSRTVQELVVAYMLKYRKFALQSVIQLTADLRTNRFLVDPPFFTFRQLRRRARSNRFSSFFENYLRGFFHREFPIAGIDGFLTRVYGGGIFLLFTRPALILWGLIVLVGLPLFFAQTLAGQVTFSRGSFGIDFPLYLAFFLVIAITHELAHAFTVKAHGRVVRRGGISIFYGLPGLYVETQDIWMEPRRARIAASWAGPYSGLIYTGLAGLALTLAPDAPWAPFVSIFGVVSLTNNVFQLMPLVQLDGYYMLMDWLEIPNLRRKALAFVRHDLWPKLRRRQKFNREERIFTVFGLLASVYTAFFVYLGVNFWWARSQHAIQEALRVPSLGSLLGLVFLVVLLVPFLLGLVRRIANAGTTAIRVIRRTAGLAQERLYRQRVLLLAEVPILAQLGRAQVQWLGRQLREERFSDGSTIVRRGDLGKRFYLIVGGEAEVIQDEADSARVIASLGRLDYFGERALLEDRPSAATVRARGDLRVLSLSAGDFRARLAGYIAADATLRQRVDERAELETFPLFEPLASKQKDLLLQKLRVESKMPGAVIVQEGDPADAFYLIRAGRVEVLRTDPQGNETLLQTLGPGEFFGEVALLLGVARTATVRSLAETQLWALDGQDFRDLLGRYFNLTGTLETTAFDRLGPDPNLFPASAGSAWVDVQPGDSAPDFTLDSVQGGRVSLADYRGKTVVLWFSRGYTCPFCRRYMAQLRAGLPRFQAAGVQILQVAPNLVGQARAFWGDQELPFPFLCDPDKSAYRLCGLCDLGAAEANKNTVKSFSFSFGHGDGLQSVRGSWLDVMNGSFGERLGHHALAAMQQGVFIIDAEGVIRQKFVLGPLDPLPNIEQLLAAAPVEAAP